MFDRKKAKTSGWDLNFYTAKRLEDMAQSLNRLARTFDHEIENGRGLTRDDGLAALQVSAASVCRGCAGCNLNEDSESEDNYYLYYLLRTFEQKGHIESSDMPQVFQADCRKKERYLNQLNRSLSKASMNLSWKNRFMESRDAVVVQFREMSQILEEFSSHLGQARDITSDYEAELQKLFRRSHMAVRNILLLEYENGQREAYLTVRTTNGRCLLSREAAELLGQAMDRSSWSPARDSRTVITRQYGAIRFLEDGNYRMLWGASRIPRQGESMSGDNYTFCENKGSQVIMSLSDGMGSGPQADEESRQVVELTEQLLEAGFSPRSALKMVNTVFLLSGRQQHPVTLDLSCIDLHSGVLESMKMGAAPTFVIEEGKVEILESSEVPVGVLNGVEPEMMSRKLWDGSRIIMVSDGVLDALPGEDKEQILKEYLEGAEEIPPQELADKILEFASSFIPTARDDMTVLAAEIWKQR